MAKEKMITKEGKPVDRKPMGPPSFKAPQKETKIVRITESDLDGDKKLEHGLIKIKGVSWAFAHALRNALGLENKRISELTDDEINKIKTVLEKPESAGIPAWLYNRQFDPITGQNMHVLSSDLVLIGKMDVKRLKTIRCFRGVRHSFNYKVRGQRTRSRGANVGGRVGGTVGVVKKKLVPQKSEEKKK